MRDLHRVEVESGELLKLQSRFERFALSSWSFGDLPETVFIEEIGGAPVVGHPGLELNADGTIRADLFTSDKIHLSLAGYEVYASRLKPLLAPTLVR